MHAAADTLPMPATGPSLGAKWIKANLLVAIMVPLTASLLPFLLNKLPMLPATSATTMAWLGAGLAFFVVAVNFAIYAILTASVLGAGLPAFSRRAWIATHLALGAVLGTILAIFAFQPGAESLFGSESEWTELLGASGSQSDGTIGLLILLPTMGAVLGGLQALVLRRAAGGMLAWIASSVIGGCAAAGVLIAFDLARSNLMRPGSTVVTSILAESPPILWVMVVAIVMLPALNRLTSKK